VAQLADEPGDEQPAEPGPTQNRPHVSVWQRTGGVRLQCGLHGFRAYGHPAHLAGTASTGEVSGGRLVDDLQSVGLASPVTCLGVARTAFLAPFGSAWSRAPTSFASSWLRSMPVRSVPSCSPWATLPATVRVSDDAPSVDRTVSLSMDAIGAAAAATTSGSTRRSRSSRAA